jgi:hypothetical protein
MYYTLTNGDIVTTCLKIAEPGVRKQNLPALQRLMIDSNKVGAEKAMAGE